MAYIGANVARSFLSACRSSSLIEKVKDNVTAILQPSTNFLVRSRITPDLLTMIGFVLNLVAATLFGLDEYRWAGLMVLVAGIFDLLDGQVARTGRTESKFGALLDSTVDRYSEIVVWFGLAVSFFCAFSFFSLVGGCAAIKI